MGINHVAMPVDYVRLDPLISRKEFDEAKGKHIPHLDFSTLS